MTFVGGYTVFLDGELNFALLLLRIFLLMDIVN